MAGKYWRKCTQDRITKDVDLRSKSTLSPFHNPIDESLQTNLIAYTPHIKVIYWTSRSLRTSNNYEIYTIKINLYWACSQLTWNYRSNTKKLSRLIGSTKRDYVWIPQPKLLRAIKIHARAVIKINEFSTTKLCS